MAPHSCNQWPIARLLAWGLMVVAVSACQRDTAKERVDTSAISPEALRGLVAETTERVSAGIRATADRIDLAANHRVTVRKCTLRLRIDVCLAAWNASFTEHPKVALVETWLLVLGIAELTDQPRTAALDEEGRALLEAFARSNIAAFDQVARELLGEAAFTRTKAEMVAWAERRDDLLVPSGSPFTGSAGGSGGGLVRRSVQDLIAIPMAPITFLQGVDKTAVSIHRATDLGDRSVRLASRIPELVRWQTELLLLEIESHPTVRGLVDQFAKLLTAATGATDLVAELPGQVGGELRTTLAAVEPQYPALQATLAEASQTVAQVDRALATAGITVDGVASALTAAATTANALRSAVEATHRFTDSFQPAPGRPPPAVVAAEPGRPFDPRDYTALAEATASALSELRGLVAEAQAITDSGAWQRRIDEVDQRVASHVANADRRLHALLARIVWSAAGLALLVFLLALAWSRLRPHPRTQAQRQPAPKASG